MSSSPDPPPSPTSTSTQHETPPSIPPSIANNSTPTNAQSTPTIDSTVNLNPFRKAMLDIFCGSAAGMVGKLVEHPWDTVKVRLQTQSLLVRPADSGRPTSTGTGTASASMSPSNAKLFRGPWDCFRKTLRVEGFRGFYQGLPSPLVGAMMENAVLFLTYNQIQALIQSGASYSSDPNKNITQRPLSLLQLSMAGALSGSCVSLILTPVELVKCQVQVQELRNGLYQTTTTAANASTTGGTSRPPHFGAARMFRKILRERGWRGLYRGAGWTMIRETGGGAAWFGMYEGVCRWMIRQKGNHYQMDHHQQQPVEVYDKRQLRPWQLALAGGLAGVAFNASFFPADVIKSIYQTRTHAELQQMVFPSGRPATTTGSEWKNRLRVVRALVVDIYQRDGIRGFYQGMGITVLRAIPSNAVIFLTYEMLTRYLEEQPSTQVDTIRDAVLEAGA